MAPIYSLCLPALDLWLQSGHPEHWTEVTYVTNAGILGYIKHRPMLSPIDYSILSPDIANNNLRQPMITRFVGYNYRHILLISLLMILSLNVSLKTNPYTMVYRYIPLNY